MIDTGMIFSICSGILIGLKLYYDLRGKRFKNKEKRKREAKEEHFMRQVKSCAEEELLKKELETLLEKEKYKAKENKRQVDNICHTLNSLKKYDAMKKNDAEYNPLPTNPFTESLKTLQEHERTKQFIRDIWYGSQYKKPDTAKELEDILKDPNTLVMSDDIDPLNQFVKIKNRGRTYIFYSDGRGCEEERREPQYYYAGEYDSKLTYRRGDVVTIGDEIRICKGDNLFELLGGVLTPNETRKVVLNDSKGEGTA